ncbi:MAG: hypothetical protein J6P03_01470, partial [Opitutales bacterium]|nr:hypothetical protein [Opitutales bacterium]
MNSVIFKDAREAGFLPFSDPRARHITDVLRLTSGSEIFAGILNEKLYKTKIEIEEGGVRFLKCETPLENPGLLNATICAAFSRPQIAKRVMFEAA